MKEEITSTKVMEISKEDTKIQKGQLYIATKNGEKIVIIGGENIINGFIPKQPVGIVLLRTQTTLAEAIKEKRKADI